MDNEISHIEALSEMNHEVFIGVMILFLVET